MACPFVHETHFFHHWSRPTTEKSNNSAPKLRWITHTRPLMNSQGWTFQTEFIALSCVFPIKCTKRQNTVISVVQNISARNYRTEFNEI